MGTKKKTLLFIWFLEEEQADLVHSFLRDTLLSSKSEKELPIILARFGLAPYFYDRTLEEMSKEFTVTRERIRQIESSAIKRLRYAASRSYFRKYVKNDFTDIPLYHNTAINQYTTPEKEIVWSKPKKTDTSPPRPIKPTPHRNKYKIRTRVGRIEHAFTYGGDIEILTIEENGEASITSINLGCDFLQKIKTDDLLFLKKLAISRDRMISRAWLTRFILDIDEA